MKGQIKVSEEDEGLVVPRAGTSHDKDDPTASVYDDGGNPLAQLQSQILELSRKHDVVMSRIWVKFKQGLLFTFQEKSSLYLLVVKRGKMFTL